MATIQGVYVALFGRPADPAGLNYFNSITKNGTDLAKINNLSGQPEYTARFTGLSNFQIINTIYQSLFGRDADVAGLNFFADALAKGTLSVNNIAIAILDGAQGNDKTIVTNKVAAADLYTKAIDTTQELIAYSGNSAAAQGRAFVTSVTTTVPTAASVDTSVAAMVTASSAGGTGAAGVTIALGSVTDAVNPNAADTKFKSTDGNDTVIGGTFLASSSVIDAGNGTDTLTATIADAAGTGITPTLKNVEVVTLSAAATVNTNFAFDATNATGVQTLNIKGVTLAAGATEALANVTKTTVVNVDTSVADAAGNTLTIGYKDATGSTDAATVSLSKVGVTGGALTVKAAGIENLTLQSNGALATDKNTVSVDVTDAKTVVLTGANGATVTEVGTVTGIKGYDASAMTGDLSLTLKNAPHTDGLTIALGKGTDTLTLTGSTTSESIVYNANNLSTVAKSDTIVGFNAGTATTTVDKFDIKAFGLGSDATVKVTTLSSNGSDVPGMFDIGAKAYIAVASTNAGASSDIYIDVNKDGNFNAASDMVIHVTGVVNTNVDKGDFILS